MIHVVLPAHLRTLARIEGDLYLDVAGQATPHHILDALESQFPMLKGTIREHSTQKRRPYLRFFVCQEDISHQPLNVPLPEAVISGREPFLIVGATAGG